ncbi:hypothetical protein DFH08DRAFT_823328 [Mycena albidolilacea]|uniref:Uncharacterized protein n=1 Tax=Mycena albidolilacea TaxID=1033008 RepID=A0AAD6Z6H5_9AGAR|nr:hypothetical protein DFH08DRAFT_823328 [Mycena albidolilacea]
MRQTKGSGNGTEEWFERALFIGIILTSLFKLATSHIRGVCSASVQAATPRVWGVDEWLDTPPRAIGEEDDGSTPTPPWNTGQYRSYDAPDAALVGRLWCSSSGPELKCTIIAEVELETNWNQLKPSTRSEGEEAAMEMLFRNIDITPVSHGSDRRPEAREFSVGMPEFITQSRETEELVALPLNTAETGTSQKVAIEVMEGESKECCRRCGN